MNRTDANVLLDALAAGRGMVCTVGAGGKKSTLYRLAEAHLALDSPRVGLTATVPMAPPPRNLVGEPLVGPPDWLVRHLPAAGRLVAFARPSAKAGRLGGLPPELVAELHERCGFTATLVKADGARMRLVKAPADDEPVLPPGATTVLAVVSAQAFGRPLGATIAHRVDRVATIAGAASGEPLAPIHVARLMASSAGALQGVGSATVVPIINMVDGRAARVAAREAACQALGMTRRFDRVVLTSMTAAEPVVEVVGRG